MYRAYYWTYYLMHQLVSKLEKIMVDHSSVIENRIKLIFQNISLCIVCSIIFTCQIPQDSDLDINVTFSIFPDEAGEIITDFDNPVSVGDTISLIAKSVSRYQFSHWVITDSIIYEREIVLVVKDDIHIIAL